MIERIKEDPSNFYRYARKRSRINSGIGPLKKDNLIISDEKKMSQILMEQYREVCSTPFENICDKNFQDEIIVKLDNEKPTMCDVSVSEDDIKKALGKLSNNSALGPDGIPVPCLKNGGQFILDALKDLTRTSIDECRLPDILKMAWVTPIWKGGQGGS